MTFSIQGISRASSRHPWRVLIAWAIVLVIAGALTSKLLPSALTNSFDFTNSPESKRADLLIGCDAVGVKDCILRGIAAAAAAT